MTEENRWLLNQWSHEYYDREETADSSASAEYYRRSRGYWHNPEDPVERDEMAFIENRRMVEHEELRLRDIRDTYRIMEINPDPILEKITARGTCTLGEVLEEETKKVKVEESEEDEFLFDPKELDI